MGGKSDLVGKCCKKQGETKGPQGELKKECSEPSKKKRSCSSTKKDKDGKETEKECHSSQEQFKKSLTDRDKFESAEGKGKGGAGETCDSTRAAFFQKGRAEKDGLEKRQASGKSGDGYSSASKRHECPPCNSTDKGEEKLRGDPSTKTSDPCASSKVSASVSGGEAMSTSKSGPCTSSRAQVEVDPCSSKKKSISAKKYNPCSQITKTTDNKDAPCKPRTSDGICAKITNYCKNLAKEYVKPKNKPRCSTVDESVMRDKICGQKPATSQPACPPNSEKGVGVETSKTSSCISRSTCPQVKKSNLGDFFPLDARNKQLNECIEKYMKIDPSEVISKCSRFANRSSVATEECKASQQQCVHSGTTKSAAAAAASKSSGLMSQLFSPRNLQLMTRWAPSAGIYLATTAVLTVYVTEWRAVLDYVPFYKAQRDGSSS